MDSSSLFEKPALREFIARAHKKSYPARHVIVHAGDTPHSLYLLLEGSVSVLVEDEEGREMVLAYLNPGDFFGEMGLFADPGERTATVRTRAPTLVAEIDYGSFRHLVHEHPDVMFEIAGQLARRLHDTTRRASDLAFLDVAGRIAHILQDLCEQPHARGMRVRISRQELARIAGCSREMAGRVLKQMEDDGLVISEGRDIVVVGATTPDEGS